MKNDPLEKDIEAHGGECAKQRNILHAKFVSPQHAGRPDRLLLAEVPEFLRPVFAQYIRFCEYKKLGKKPTAAQEREHARLRALGFRVDVIDNKADARRMVMEMGNQSG